MNMAQAIIQHVPSESANADNTAVFIGPSGNSWRARYPAADSGTSKTVPYPSSLTNRDLSSVLRIAVKMARPEN
jgi:hypothetical protein